MRPTYFSSSAGDAPEAYAFTLPGEYVIGRFNSYGVCLGVVLDQQVVLYFNLRIGGDFAVVVSRVFVIDVAYYQAVVLGPVESAVLHESSVVQEQWGGVF